MKDMSHPLARARGHGSAKSGVRHWVAQRVSAVVLLLLVPWALWNACSLASQSYTEVSAFVASPINASLGIAFLLALVYHGMLGLQVVIEDYVHNGAAELALQLLVRLASGLAAIIGVIYLLKPVLGG